jgi:hypothetical protein
VIRVKLNESEAEGSPITFSTNVDAKINTKIRKRTGFNNCTFENFIKPSSSHKLGNACLVKILYTRKIVAIFEIKGKGFDNRVDANYSSDGDNLLGWSFQWN